MHECEDIMSLHSLEDMLEDEIQSKCFTTTTRKLYVYMSHIRAVSQYSSAESLHQYFAYRKTLREDTRHSLDVC